MPKIGDLVRYDPDWTITEEEERKVYTIVFVDTVNRYAIMECINDTSLVDPERATVGFYMIEKIF